MGNAAATLARRAKRPFKNFAVEARTERILAKEKPTPAPWHPSTQKRIDELLKENSNVIEEQSKKDPSLDDRLRKVFVTSGNPSLAKENASKQLPVERKNFEAPEYGYQEPVRVSKGKLSLRQALVMISTFRQDPNLHSALSLAKEYTLHPKTTENILKHFKTFDYYQPPTSKVKIEAKDYITLNKVLPTSNQTANPQISDGGIKS